MRQRLDGDPLSGHIFCFINRRKNMLKCLVHDRTGFLIYYKKLARGTFQLPEVSEGTTRALIDAGTLTLILEGIDLKSVKRRVRHHRHVWPAAES